MNNQYLRALEAARQSTERQRIEYKSRDKWWLRLYDQDGQAGLVDIEDVIDLSGQLRSQSNIYNRANAMFSRPHGQPPAPNEITLTATDTYGSDVERDAITGLVEDALDALYKKIKLTETQKRTIDLGREAHGNGQTASTYIARKEGITRVAAWRRLDRISAKMLTLDTKHVILSSKQVIKQACVVCGKQLDERTPRPLCWQHHRLHIDDRYAQEQTPLTYDKVEALLREAS